MQFGLDPSCVEGFSHCDGKVTAPGRDIEHGESCTAGIASTEHLADRTDDRTGSIADDVQATEPSQGSSMHVRIDIRVVHQLGL